MNYSNKLSLISWIISITVINNIIINTPKSGIIYYLIILIGLIYCLTQSRVKAIDLSMSFLYICCLISIIGNNIPSFFHPWGRFVSFILVTTLVSPFLKSDFLENFRFKTFQIIQLILEYVVIASTLAYFAGKAYNMGFFAGITTHSMLMAPISANVILSSLYNITCNKHKHNKIKTSYYILLICCALICLLLAASRTAVIAVIVSILCYYSLIYRNNKIRFIKQLLLLVIITAMTFPIWKTYAEVIINKNEGSIDAGGITSSRDALWEKRLVEFNSSPIIGIGFSTVSTDSLTGSTFDIATGRIETGSSWLSCLSMIGILGTVATMIIFFKSYYKISSPLNTDLHLSAYLFSLMIFFSIHMIAEGYIFAAGNFLFFNVWLLIGCAESLKRRDSYK